MADFPIDTVVEGEPRQHIEYIARRAIRQPFAGGRGGIIRVRLEVRLAAADKAPVVVRGELERLATEPRSSLSR
jgi:hypothetical protein